MCRAGTYQTEIRVKDLFPRLPRHDYIFTQQTDRHFVSIIYRMIKKCPYAEKCVFLQKDAKMIESLVRKNFMYKNDNRKESEANYEVLK